MLNLQLFVIPKWVHAVVLSALMLGVFWRGGWRERFIASSHLAQFVITVTACRFVMCWRDGLPNPIWRTLASDTAMLAVCLFCAWRTERHLLLGASSFALLSVITDLLGLFMPGVTVWAYGSANIVWAYLLDLCVLWSALSDPPHDGRRTLAKATPVVASSTSDTPPSPR